jgi:hypothetical protein
MREAGLKPLGKTEPFYAGSRGKDCRLEGAKMQSIAGPHPNRRLGSEMRCDTPCNLEEPPGALA